MYIYTQLTKGATDSQDGRSQRQGQPKPLPRTGSTTRQLISQRRASFPTPQPSLQQVRARRRPTALQARGEGCWMKEGDEGWAG